MERARRDVIVTMERARRDVIVTMKRAGRDIIVAARTQRMDWDLEFEGEHALSFHASSDLS